MAGGGVGVGGEAKLAVAGDVDGDLEDFWWGVSRVVVCELGGGDMRKDGER